MAGSPWFAGISLTKCQDMTIEQVDLAVGCHELLEAMDDHNFIPW